MAAILNSALPWASLPAMFLAGWLVSERRQQRQRRLAEAELRKSRTSLAKAQALAMIGNWQWEVASNELIWSDQMFRILGLEPGELVPDFHAALARTCPEDRGILRKSLRRFRIGAERPPVEFRLEHPDGSLRWVQSIIEVERGADGRALRLVGTFQDITDRRTTEEAFRQAQKMESLGLLAGGIAHDFNNLLSAIGGNLELAQMSMGPQPEAGAFLLRIEKILRRAAQLTQQLLAYSGKGRFVVRPLCLNAVAEEMAKLLEVSISKRVNLVYRFQEGLPLTDADGAQLQQVIMNLVTNASEAIGDRDGTITVRTGAEHLAGPGGQLEQHGWTLAPGLYVTLEVTDSGCGMDAETRRRLFDPFFTTKVSGRGLGLSAMLGILRGHHAGIRIHSSPGQGSSFKLFFPASAGAAAEEAVPAAAGEAAARAAGRILVVDDEADILTASAELLTALGYQAVLAEDGLDALECYSAAPGEYDLVILDLSMPRMDGREAAQALRALDPEARILLCSGYNEADATRGFAPGVLAGFLQKPYSVRELRERVAAVLQSKA
jgi:PAS domain S-box-containing protein